MTEFSALKQFLSLTFLKIRVFNNLLCYYTENDVYLKVRGNNYSSFVSPRTGRISCSQIFFKTGVLKYSANFTSKHLCWSLF